MRFAFITLLFFCGETISAQCTSTGVTNGSVFADNNTTGTVAWLNPSFAQSSDNSYATASVSLSLLSSATTHYLVATGFGFSIPALSTICGIQVDVEKSYQIFLGLLSSVNDNSVKIVKGGAISGVERASVANWSSSNTYSSYGSNADLWGLTWAPSDINSSNFGVAISAKVSSGVAALNINALIDHIRITVFYNTTVPVTFGKFSGEQVQDKIKLTWSTASESNSSYFVPEKLMQGTNNWIALDKTPAAFFSSTEKNYEAFDVSPEPDNIYRVKEVDIDNRFIYSKTISVPYKQDGGLFINTYPNPAKGTIYIHSSQPVLFYRLVDISGKECLNAPIITPARDLKIPTTKFANGIYCLVIQTGITQSSRKIIINN